MAQNLAWMSVSCDFCALSGRRPASGCSPVQRNPTESGVSVCDREVSKMRRPWPTSGLCTMEKYNTKCKFDLVEFTIFI